MAVAVPVGSRRGCSAGMWRVSLGAPVWPTMWRASLDAPGGLRLRWRDTVGLLAMHVAEWSGSIWRYVQQWGEQGSGVLVQRMSVRLSGPVCELGQRRNVGIQASATPRGVHAWTLQRASRMCSKLHVRSCLGVLLV